MCREFRRTTNQFISPFGRSGVRRADSPAAARNPPYNRGMQTMSRERIERVAKELVDAMTRSRAVSLLKDRDAVRQAISHALADELKREEEREENVRRRLAAMRKTPPRGTREWEQLFRTLMEEEYLREGLDT